VTTAHIAFETETGRILLIHRYEGEPGPPYGAQRVAALLTNVAEDAITVISVPADEIDPARSYTVDPSRGAMTETAAGQDGVRSSVTELHPPGQDSP
jgi:hypothetical protein